MQKIIALGALLGLALLTGGCAGIPLISSAMDALNPANKPLEIHNQTEVRLTEGNFVTVKTNVVGQARGFSLLGFITLVPARFQIAMDRMYSSAEMKTGQAQTLGDLIVEHTSAYWILFSIPRVSVRADVVEFTPNTATIILPHPPAESPPPAQGDKSSARVL